MNKQQKRKVRVRYCYTETTIPPGCRKPREQRRDDGELEIGIPEVSSDDAPVALRASGTFLRREAPYSVEYRWWRGQLWTSLNIDHNGEPRGRNPYEDNWDWPEWRDAIDIRCSDGTNGSFEFGYCQAKRLAREEVTARIRALARRQLIVDGKPYRSIGEPRYVVHTFGFGNNHGGTAVSLIFHFNCNLKRSNYFSLLDRPAAIARGAKVAERRGDTKSLPMKPSGPHWEILIPEALRIAVRK